MPKKERSTVGDLRGASRLAVEATTGVMELVESMHSTIAGGPDILGRPLERPAKIVTGLVYGYVRGVTKLVGASVDVALSQLEPLLGSSAPGSERDAVLAALNGVLGDYLSETGNPLAIQMRLRSGGHVLRLEQEALAASLPEARGKLVVLVHGSGMNDAQWSRRGHDHGAVLAKDLGYTPVYVRYNSGQHVSSNGRELATLLEQLVSAWPVPLEELVVVAFSMGGLVARSACHVGEAAGHVWRKKLDKLVFLGTPHHGAPLERAGNMFQALLGVTRYSAPLARLGKLRSAGVTDMRFGIVLDDHWHGRDRFAHADDPRELVRLPDGVTCYAIAATRSAEAAGKLRSDGMVPVDSALGRHEKPELTLAFPETHQWIGVGMGHLDLLDRHDVYSAIRDFLARDTAPE